MQVARKVVETLMCDACDAKGIEVKATEELSLKGETFDLCDEHASRFLVFLMDAMKPSQNIAKSA
jgi:hypothetical protein